MTDDPPPRPTTRPDESRSDEDDPAQTGADDAERRDSGADESVSTDESVSMDESTSTEGATDAEEPAGREESTDAEVPPGVRNYERFSKMDGARYERANDFLRERTYITAREWAIARLCADFRTETGIEMTKIGKHLPELVPFMTDTYTPQAVNQARSAFEGKVRKAGATFLYGAMCDFFTAEQLDDVMYEATEVAKFLLEVEGVDLAVEEELESEERISSTMREVRAQSAALRHDELTCPHCGEEFSPDDSD